MDTKRYLLSELGEKMILLGKQGESGALRIEFDCAPWLEDYPAATVKLFVFNKAHRQDDPILPVLGSEGTLRVWIVGEDETATSGHGVIELVLQDADTGSTLKSATGYTTVIKSPSAGIEAREAQVGYVRYDLDQSEILTEEQKAIARNNIGAGTGSGTGGGITGETDPTVPAWAKQPSKPTYTAAEVGALPATTVIPTVPETLPNPQPIVINGVSYDGSVRKEITVQTEAGAGIDDATPSTTTTYSSSKIDELLNEQKEAKADKAYMVELFNELKALILAGNTETAIAVLDQAILDNAVLA